MSPALSDKEVTQGGIEFGEGQRRDPLRKAAKISSGKIIGFLLLVLFGASWFKLNTLREEANK